jgi:uncharacterized XkdX family phage protein
MDWFKICSEYFKLGFYDHNTLKIFVAKNKITVDQYKEITGQDYTTA